MGAYRMPLLQKRLYKSDALVEAWLEQADRVGDVHVNQSLDTLLPYLKLGPMAEKMARLRHRTVADQVMQIPKNSGSNFLPDP